MRALVAILRITLLFVGDIRTLKEYVLWVCLLDWQVSHPISLSYRWRRAADWNRSSKTSLSGETTLGFTDVMSIFSFRSCSMYKRTLGIRCSLADLQQFFTGKLYVLMYQLKLPAEELLWLALSCTEDPSVPGVTGGHWKSSLWPPYKILYDTWEPCHLCSMFMCSDSYHDTCCIM